VSNLVFVKFTLLLTPCIFIKYLIKKHGVSNNVKFTKTKFDIHRSVRTVHSAIFHVRFLVLIILRYKLFDCEHLKILFKKFLIIFFPFLISKMGGGGSEETRTLRFSLRIKVNCIFPRTRNEFPQKTVVTVMKASSQSHHYCIVLPFNKWRLMFPQSAFNATTLLFN